MNLINQHIVINVDAILSAVNCTVGSAVQPITKRHLKAARDAGGDAIDLDPADGNFVGTL